jgi:hypothetical protein
MTKMEFEILCSNNAINQLEEVLNYIEEDSPKSALKIRYNDPN